jgi:ankyrin repeat protein
VAPTILLAIGRIAICDGPEVSIKLMKSLVRRNILLGAIGLVLFPAAALAQAGQVPLFQSIQNRQSLSRFQELLDGGADPSQADGDGDTAMHYAAAARDPGYLRILLAHGVSGNMPNRITGRTPIVSAMMYERDRQFDMLLAAGVNLGRADRTGNTPLHVAAQINDPGRVLALLKAGAPANARNKQGQTFQRYLFMTREGLLSAEARTARRAVVTWLRQNGIPVEGE